MAKQTGIVKLKGTIGGISFYKNKFGHQAREKGGVSGERIASDPAFQRTRENGAEFGRPGKASKFVRMALRTLLQNGKDGLVVRNGIQYPLKNGNFNSLFVVKVSAS